MKYVRLLRLQDQHFQFGFALAAGVYLRGQIAWMTAWAIATTLISVAAFISNEMTDKEDVDKYSWNKVHLSKTEVMDSRKVALIWWACSIGGVSIAYGLDVFWPAVVMLLIGTAYSAKPVRLKGRVVVDVLAQLSVWFWIPFMAPVFYFGKVDSFFWSFILVISLLAWGFFYPYQLADFSADKRAGLRGTHVVLGQRLSLILGLITLVLGSSGYFAFGIFERQLWSVAFMVMGVVLFFHYLYWFRQPEGRRERAMQRAIAYMKPASWLMIPYIIWWLFR